MNHSAPPLRCTWLCAIALALAAADPVITLDTVWQDTAGHEIKAQGGNIIRLDGLFHWYGVAFTGDHPAQVRCYTSPDLATWTAAGTVLDRPPSRRIKVLRHPVTGRFHLFARSGAGLVVGTSVGPAGPFALAAVTPLPGARGDGDVAPVCDDEGKAHVVYAAGDAPTGDDRMVIATLDADWTRVGTVVHTFPAAAVECPALWRNGATWYCTASGRNGWFGSDISFSTTSALAGPWTPWKKVRKSSFNALHNTVLRIDGSAGPLFVCMLDRWSRFTHYGVGSQVWLPIEFVDDAPVITWLRPWYPDVAQGTYQHDLRRYGLYRGWPKDLKTP